MLKIARYLQPSDDLKFFLKKNVYDTALAYSISQAYQYVFSVNQPKCEQNFLGSNTGVITYERDRPIIRALSIFVLGDNLIDTLIEYNQNTGQKINLFSVHALHLIGMSALIYSSFGLHGVAVYSLYRLAKKCLNIFESRTKILYVFRHS